MREERDFKLLFLGLALWIGSATVGLLHSYWLLLSLPLFLLIGRKYGTFLLVIALVGSFNIGLHQIALTHNALRPFMENKNLVHLLAQVKTDPKLGSAKVVGSTLRPASTTFLATSLVVEGGKMRLPLRFSTYQHITFSPGTVIESDVLIYPTQERSLAALVVTRGPIVVLHGPGVMGRLTTRIRTAFKLQVHKLTGDGANLIPGLVLGDTSLESSGFINQMRRAGLTHLTAVSGENFAIISAFLLWAMQWIFRRLRTRIIITSFSLIGFIYLVRPSPSVMRASVMTAALLFARARGAKAGGLPALGLAITVLILIDPFQSVDPGFALSVGATAGILVLVPILTARNIPEPIAIPLAATIFCTPIIIAISGQFSLVSIPANLLVSAAVAPITVAGFIASLLSPIFPSFSFLIVAAVLPFSIWIAFIAHHASEIAILVLPKSFMGAGIACLALYGLFKKMWKIGLLVVLIVSSYFFFQSTAWPNSNWRIVNCDVGQGDGEVINLGNHQAIVIDTGPDPVLIDQCLKALQINTIPLLVLTHSHADHIAGLSGVLKGRAVGQIWRTATQGQHFELKAPVGQVDIRVLWPKDPQARFEVNPGDGSAVNNTSIALLIDIAGLTFFTGGDVEPPAQQAILESGLVHRVDIMKISHHGSAYQYLPLLDALHPTVAFISVGKGNTYGHPALSTLTVLRDRGVAVYRTDVSGALEYDADKSVHTHRKGLVALA
ncbi:MAG: ComEC/Rec2 family competence protein [Actinomycetes bacterium]